jgi:hypothetical protein
MELEDTANSNGLATPNPKVPRFLQNRRSERLRAGFFSRERERRVKIPRIEIIPAKKTENRDHRPQSAGKIRFGSTLSIEGQGPKYM